MGGGVVIQGPLIENALLLIRPEYWGDGGGHLSPLPPLFHRSCSKVPLLFANKFPVRWTSRQGKTIVVQVTKLCSTCILMSVGSWSFKLTGTKLAWFYQKKWMGFKEIAAFCELKKCQLPEIDEIFYFKNCLYYMKKQFLIHFFR